LFLKLFSLLFVHFGQSAPFYDLISFTVSPNFWGRFILVGFRVFNAVVEDDLSKTCPSPPRPPSPCEKACMLGNEIIEKIITE